MLDSIWQLLANYGVNTQEIADAIHTLINIDANGNIVGEGGKLAPLIDFPIIGMILKGFGSLAPSVAAAAETIV